MFLLDLLASLTAILLTMSLPFTVLFQGYVLSNFHFQTIAFDDCLSILVTLVLQQFPPTTSWPIPLFAH